MRAEALDEVAPPVWSKGERDIRRVRRGDNESSNYYIRKSGGTTLSPHYMRRPQREQCEVRD